MGLTYKTCVADRRTIQLITKCRDIQTTMVTIYRVLCNGRTESSLTEGPCTWLQQSIKFRLIQASHKRGFALKIYMQIYLSMTGYKRLIALQFNVAFHNSDDKRPRFTASCLSWCQCLRQYPKSWEDSSTEMMSFFKLLSSSSSYLLINSNKIGLLNKVWQPFPRKHLT